MTCYRPLKGFRDLEQGGRLEFKHPYPGSSRWMSQPARCRRCIGCQTDLARDWSVRCYHESQMHERNCFLTLTYDRAHLPPHGMLNWRDVELFLKRLRKWAGDAHFLFYGVEEYGGVSRRPHYHLCIFGLDFDDRVFTRMSGSGFKVYESATLTRLWGNGIAAIGDLTVETASYCTRYATKTDLSDSARPTDYIKKADRAPWRFDAHGNKYRYVPERQHMSKGRGIGRAWFEKFHMDLWAYDAVILPGGVKVPIPDAYLRWLRQWCEDDYANVKERRAQLVTQNMGHFANSMPARLRVREQVQTARLSFKKRESV